MALDGTILRIRGGFMHFSREDLEYDFEYIIYGVLAFLFAMLLFV